MNTRNVRQRLAMGLTHGWLPADGRAALPATAGWMRARLIELVRTVDIGPLDVAPRRRVTFIVKIYRDLERKALFFPIVWRRDTFRLTPAFTRRPADRQLEVIDPAFAPDAFARTSDEAVLKAIAAQITASCEQRGRRRQR